MAFLAGYDKGVSFTPAGGGATAINITAHSWSEQVEKLDVSHSGTAGKQALIAGLLRGDGNIKANFDSAAMPFAAAPNVKAGTKGVMT